MLGPGLFDWPILSESLSTKARLPDDVRLTRGGLALAGYLEKQETRRTATRISIRTGLPRFLLRASGWLLHAWRPVRTRAIQSPQ